MVRRRRMLAPALALAVALAAPACAAGSPSVSAEPATELPAGVTAHFTQLRSDVAARQGQVTVTNGSDEPLTLGAVRIDDPRFVEPAERVVERQSTLAPGAAVDVRVQLADAACDADRDAEASVTLAYSTGDAAPAREATMPLPDPLDVFGPLHERECRSQALAGAASVVFSSFEPSEPGAPARLELEIVPTGEGDAVIDAVQTTNLLTFGSTAGDAGDDDGTGEEYPIGVDIVVGDTDPVLVAVPIVPLRCDPHAVQEDKRGTIFDVSVTVDGETGEVELFVGEEMRGRILTWVAQWCGFGS